MMNDRYHTVRTIRTGFDKEGLEKASNWFSMLLLLPCCQWIGGWMIEAPKVFTIISGKFYMIPWHCDGVFGFPGLGFPMWLNDVLRGGQAKVLVVRGGGIDTMPKCLLK